MKKIGFIGIGVMGSPMVLNLMKAGFEVTVYSRTRAKCETVLQAGAAWAASPAQCAQGQDAVITMVGYPTDVRQVYFGEGGIFESVQSGLLLIDMTTTSPRLSQEIAERAEEAGALALDAPGVRRRCGRAKRHAGHYGWAVMKRRLNRQSPCLRPWAKTLCTRALPVPGSIPKWQTKLRLPVR